MANISDYLCLKLLDHVFRGVAYPVPTLYVSLHTADPGETGTDEAAGGSYDRQAAPSFAAAALDLTIPTIKNSAGVTFLDMPAGTFTHLGFWDDPAAGNFVWKLLLTDGAGTPTPVTTIAGEAVSFTNDQIFPTLD